MAWFLLPTRLLANRNRGGGTHMLRHTGMCYNFENPIHGFHFSCKNPDIWIWFSKFSGVGLRKFSVFAAKWVLFSEKSLNMGIYFLKNYPRTWVWVLNYQRHIPDQSKSEYPPEPEWCRCITIVAMSCILHKLLAFIVTPLAPTFLGSRSLCYYAHVIDIDEKKVAVFD